MITPSIDLPVLSVSGLTQSIKLLLEGQFKFVSVQGEISNCKLQSSGHLYFSLKDAQSQIGAVMFKGDLASVDSIPKDGDQVIVKGAVNVYAPSGRYQIVVRSMEKAGLGALLLQLEALKAKLKAQGYFDAARKKPLPKFPKTIGVVTSPTGAVIQDILNVLTRRISGFHLILNPVKVQGPGSAQEIAAAIDFFNRHQLADVLIVGRGGGSLEDLWAFNEEAVIQAIYNSKIPIVSAVGHETDFTLADFVADVRAPTPSAAAELVVQEKGAELQKLAQMQRGIRQGLGHLLRLKKEQLQSISRHPIMATPYTLIGPSMQRLDETKASLDRSMKEKLYNTKQKLFSLKRETEALKPSRRIQHVREKLSMLTQSLDQSWAKRKERDLRKLQEITKLLKAIDPKNLLQKGYAMVFSEMSKSIITSVRSLSSGDSIRLLFADGDARATVSEKGK